MYWASLNEVGLAWQNECDTFTVTAPKAAAVFETSGTGNWWIDAKWDRVGPGGARPFPHNFGFNGTEAVGSTARQE
jgi:hypothetical protein